MKPWIKRTLVGLAAAAALLGGLAAWAHRHHHADHLAWRTVSAAEVAPLQARALERASRRLELDVAQKARLTTLADRVREARNAVVAASADPRLELQAALAGPKLDRGRVNTLVQAQLAAAGTQGSLLVDAAAEFYDSLRPEQQAQLRRMVARAAERGHGDDEGRGQ